MRRAGAFAVGKLKEVGREADMSWSLMTLSGKEKWRCDEEQY
jgi:hypothetical protein